MDSATLELSNYFGQILAYVRFSARQKYYCDAKFCEVVGNSLDFIQRTLSHIGVSIDYVALLAREVTTRRDIELDIDRRILEECRLRECLVR
jgi:hypothetical protein